MPIKNADRGRTRPETSRGAGEIALHTEWLEGMQELTTNGHPVEISPLFALDADELAEKIDDDSLADSPNRKRTPPSQRNSGNSPCSTQ